MKILAISHALPQERYQRCPQCDTLFSLPDVKSSQSAHCPRCNAKILNGRDWSMTRLTAMAITMILLMPFAFGQSLVDIRLLGTNISASLAGGILQMAEQGNVISASMVAFCTIGAPVTLVASIIYLFFGQRLGMNLRPVLLMLDRLKEWVMLDIYLVGIAVACIKVQDYADLQPGAGLVAYLALTLLSLVTLIHLNVEQLWQRFYPQPQALVADHSLQVCLNCHHTGSADERGRCPRCHTPLRLRRRHSLQKSWAALIASIVLLLPANLLPISIIYLNGSRQEDTIFSGILSLASGNIPVAAVVFIASILVPFTKVIVLLTLLLSIHFKCQQGLKTRIRLLRVVTWVGRWSMLDLFVIALTMSLVNRDQLLAFTMGPAAFYFGSAVVLTILAVEWLDSRLLWDAHATGNADYTD
ncbi:membrane integrity lipid transport subunit YebS [Erwiniaceae bacterium BAC15a-03b]|uniref:Membrane integrity lipid transport subunit YebS n=1 Tax=Winslowiella arboricola TaxID=2978220 RepID=A0A9J6PPH5_9GAMM|nr:membrane integrity lipid transport subunit YebS [Winslowiella arboricola]MCU5775820.1 membrane integrity lipid transport subunit YebS [Winslowiella arboricola]MCU5779330.1 membrane integrity lipid transport subunit YebS [Winslowiella arboricola]